MRIYVEARPNAKKEKTEQLDQTHFKITVKELPKDGKANEAIAKALAERLGVARSRIRLDSGFSSRSKIFEVL